MRTDQLIAALSKDLKPTKKLPAQWILYSEILALNALLFCTGIIGWYFIKHEVHIPWGRSFLEILLLFITLLLNSYFAVRSISPHYAKARTMHWTEIFIAGWFLVLLIAFKGNYSEDPAEALVALQYKTWFCPMVITSMALPLFLLALAFARRGALLFPRTTYFYIAMMSFCLGTFGLSFICPWDDPLHEILWHFLPMVFSIFAAYWITTKIHQYFFNN